jgi:TPR repeat protein
MRGKLGIWSALAAGIFAALLAATPAALRVAHLHWPAWPLALVGAILTWLAGITRPVTNALTQIWAERARRGLDQQDRARELERAVGGRDRGLPTAGEIVGRALLGIHPSIPLPSDADSSLAPDLPLYVPRDVDADLHAWVTAHMASGGFLLLVGPAASGKSRCAYELVHHMLSDWPIFMPSTAGQVTDYFGTDPALGRLVVWLNETQKFLGSGGLTTETVRRILALPWPVIIMGTIWPQSYDTLASASGTGLGHATQDAREILTMLAQRKDMLPSFSAAELDRAGSLAARDPRIAEALAESASHNLAETLAAAPDLISRWLNAADPYGAAVITAAVIARRCGHPEPLPAAILQPLAEGVLTRAQRGRATAHWFTDALTWARSPVRGDAAPLTPQAATPGIVDGDQVSDVLVQHSIRDRTTPGHKITEYTWQLLIEHATPRACRSIADAAYQQRHIHQSAITEQATRKAASAGNTDAMSNLGVLLREQGHTDEAEYWYRQAASAGNTDAMSNLGVLLRGQGQADEAEYWYRGAASAGNTYAMSNLGALLEEQGQADEAEYWYRGAASGGNTYAMSNLGALLEEQGQADEAEYWYRGAASGGSTNAMSNLGALLRKQGRSAESEYWYRTAADAGSTDAMFHLGALLRRQGRSAESEQWYRKAADAGDTGATFYLGAMLLRQGKSAQAEQWYRKAADAGKTGAILKLEALMEGQGKIIEAASTAAWSGDGHSKTAEAEQWYRKRVDIQDD